MKSELFPTLSDIAFAEKDPDIITQEVLSLYERLTGRTLARSDPVRLFLDAVILLIIQQRNIIDFAAKQNLLAYSEGEYLEHLGALLGVSRLDPSSASCTLRFTAETESENDRVIPAGVRAAKGDDVFVTDTDCVIPAGELTGDVTATAQTAGASLNGYIPGEINTLLDALSFRVRVSNITTTSGGSDTETDENLRERIQIAPESFSVAGPKNAYVFWAKTANPDIADVAVIGPPVIAPGHVDIYPLMVNGELPSDEVIAQVMETCNREDIRPDTDYLSVKCPEVINFDLHVNFWIDERKASSAMLLASQVNAAADAWVLWQKSALGRDINPSELVHRMVEAGAKRVEVVSPEFRVLEDWQVGIAENIVVNYAGLERG